MNAWQVTINQRLSEDSDTWRDGTFTEYVQTLEQAARIVSRFHGDEPGRHVISITITAIHIRLEENK